MRRSMIISRTGRRGLTNREKQVPLENIRKEIMAHVEAVG